RRDVEAREQARRDLRVVCLAFEAREELQILARRQAVVQGRPLRDPAHGRVVDSLDVAFARLQRPREKREQRRLSRAVRTDEGDRLPAGDIDVGRLERDLRTEPARNAARAQERLADGQRRAAAGGGGAGSSPTSTGGTPP